jgi:large subunit ribosomal protein L9
MKVILTEEVPNLGAAGDMVNVAVGYARNYLLPRKLAIQATTGNVKALDHHRRTIEARQKKLAHGAEAVGRRVSATSITITARAGEAGRLYGSVTSADIAAELKRALDVEVDKRKIEIREPIKVLGEHTVKVRLHRDVQVPVTVSVLAEAGAEEPQAAPATEQPGEEQRQGGAAPAQAPAAPAEIGQEPPAAPGEQETPAG